MLVFMVEGGWDAGHSLLGEKCADNQTIVDISEEVHSRKHKISILEGTREIILFTLSSILLHLCYNFLYPNCYFQDNIHRLNPIFKG